MRAWRVHVTLIAACLTLAGCATHRPQPAEAPKPAPKASELPRKKAPARPPSGPELNMAQWHIQCANAELAMLCRKSDRTDRRCAVKQAGRYRWTYGSYCHRALPCYRKACN